jgi:hypothetical protein
MHVSKIIGSILFAFVAAFGIVGQETSERELAGRFAPVFFQALGPNPRSDYITNFDFDGDWRGDNNWANAENKSFPLKAYVYYALSETQTHYFIQYAVFHPRDYKGGELKGQVVSRLLRRGARIVGSRDPTGLLDEATMAHENDLEGVLVVVAKGGNDIASARVVYVETLKHNTFVSFIAGEAAHPRYNNIKADGHNVLVYIEPMGHGIEAYTGEDAQTLNTEFVIYRFTGTAEDPEEVKEGPVGYDLVPIETTLWPRAKPTHPNTKRMYGIFNNYGVRSIHVLQPNGKPAKKSVRLGRLGSAFLGKVGGKNMARPPWGWFDRNRRRDPLGYWFFDPARIVKRSFSLDSSFSIVYTRPPFWAR